MLTRDLLQCRSRVLVERAVRDGRGSRLQARSHWGRDRWRAGSRRAATGRGQRVAWRTSGSWSRCPPYDGTTGNPPSSVMLRRRVARRVGVERPPTGRLALIGALDAQGMGVPALPTERRAARRQRRRAKSRTGSGSGALIACGRRVSGARGASARSRVPSLSHDAAPATSASMGSPGSRVAVTFNDPPTDTSTPPSRRSTRT